MSRSCCTWRRRDLLGLVVGITAAWPLLVRAQQKALPVIGWLLARSVPPTRVEGPVRRGLREIGYVEDESFTAEYRAADGHYDRLPGLAQDLVQRKVDLIMTLGGTPTALAAKNATSTIPIVFTNVSDPVSAGLVASLARPGGNVTGVADLTAELTPKQLEVLTELVPQAKAIALLVNPDNPLVTETVVKAAREAAYSKGLDLLIVKAANDEEIDAAFATLLQLHADALLVAGDQFFTLRNERLAQLAAQHSIPGMYNGPGWVGRGGLVSYGEDADDSGRQAGIYAGRILNGEKPANLPVQRPSKFRLGINLKTAKAFDVAVPQSLLSRADQVVE